MATITYEHVTKRFDETIAVNDLSIDVADGEFLVLVGPSGCGKTTALRMLAGLEDISAGRILIGERVVNNVAPGKRNIAMVFQSYALYPHMTVYGNLAFSLKNFNVPKNEIDRRVREAAEVLELGALLKRKPKQLSGGQRQRVALGRAIVREPLAFLMDEPLSNLDAALRVQTRAEILKLQNRLGTTTIYVTHDQIEAMTMGDRIAVMNLGVLQQIGSPVELYTHPANTFVATFIGSPAMNLLPSGALGVGIGGSGRLVGFRPEDVQLANGARGDRAEYDATVEVVQYLGDEQLAYLKLQDAEVVAKLPIEDELQLGMRRKFAVPYRKLHLFDEESGKALGTVA
ncbi:MAG: ATP-binding cassette domain-containing protein [Actinobacteria bacterium]|nr:MAG: ATP-binding cassette domain-containing protein [Actinomycetota bacterium]TML71878.1 MAG: ATP-binding cassette domain-containing protein [Actinomycetota bacterium]